MKKKSIFLIIIIFILNISSCFFSRIVLADDDLGIGFQISPIYPTTQIDVDKGYYYVQTTPGEKQTLELMVSNTSDNEITVKPSVENAIASTRGTIGYNEDVKLIDSSLKNPLTDILIPNQESLTIEPRGEKKLTFSLDTPSEPYEGIKMGRVKVTQIEDNKKEKVGLSVEYEYALGVILSQNGDAFNDGKTLKLSDVKPTIDLGKKVVSARLVNPEPKTIENLKVRSYVTKKGSEVKLKQNNIDNFAFPPNSKLEFLIPWGLSNFEPGDYIFYFNAENGYDNFKLKKEFTIRGDEAKQLNKESAFTVNTSTAIKIIIILLNIFLMGVSVFIVIRNKKWLIKLKKRKKGKPRKKRRH